MLLVKKIKLLQIKLISLVTQALAQKKPFPKDMGKGFNIKNENGLLFIFFAFFHLVFQCRKCIQIT